MKQQNILSFAVFVLCSFFFGTLAQGPASAPAQVTPTTPAAQTPAAQVPETSGSVDVVKILNKAGHFAIFIRLLKATGEASDIFTELNTTNNGITIFAPTDAAFSSLQAGILNTLSDGQKIKLTQYHILSKHVALSQFQTETNPEKTLAGAGVNVTTTGSIVNITTGVVNTSISGTVYTDSQLAIYQVDKVLLPADTFGGMAPAPAPGLAKPSKKKQPESVETPVTPKDVSGAEGSALLHNAMFIVVGLVCATMNMNFL